MRTLAALLLAASAFGQYLETTLTLPDSFGGELSLRCIAVNTTNNTFVVSGQEGEHAIAADAVTGVKVARVPTGWFTIDACYNPVANKVYCANYYDSQLTVIDGATNQVLAQVGVGWSGYSLCVNTRDNKVYCAMFTASQLSVIDGQTNTLRGTVRTGSTPSFVVYGRGPNRVWATGEGDNTVTVVDGATDTVVATVRVGDTPRALCYNEAADKVYCANALDNSVSVIDGWTNAVLATLPALARCRHAAQQGLLREHEHRRSAGLRRRRRQPARPRAGRGQTSGPVLGRAARPRLLCGPGLAQRDSHRLRLRLGHRHGAGR
jgi:YVTN family beta-propeller protein